MDGTAVRGEINPPSFEVGDIDEIIAGTAPVLGAGESGTVLNDGVLVFTEGRVDGNTVGCMKSVGDKVSFWDGDTVEGFAVGAGNDDGKASN